jgi:putative ABC transport system substrate-binding protein
MNKRRKLVMALGAGALTAPFGAFAQQQGKVWRIGFLSPFQSDKDQRFDVFKQQLRDLGHVEGKTIVIDYLSTEGNSDRMPALSAELVRRSVDVIMAAGGTPAAIAAKNATRTIPVVFVGISDPVGRGLVASLARPGGNVTGITIQSRDTAGKVLSLLKEIVPSAKRIAILSNPMNSSLPFVISQMQASAKTLHVEIAVANARAPAEFEKAFAEIERYSPAGLIILGDSLFTIEAGRIAIFAAKHRLPTIGGISVVPESGGLMSYGANRLDLVRRAAFLVDKILKGAKPRDLPVEQPTTFELVVNMKTARALGIKIPNSILVQATKVIE